MLISRNMHVTIMGVLTTPTNMALSPVSSHLIARGLRTACALEARTHMKRDKIRRACVREHADIHLAVKALQKYQRIPNLNQHLADLPRDSHVSRVRNRCVLTGRGNGVYSMYRLSRMKFRQYADKGLIAGMKRSSW